MLARGHVAVETFEEIAEKNARNPPSGQFPLDRLMMGGGKSLRMKMYKVGA